jgi:hypothetical protein
LKLVLKCESVIQNLQHLLCCAVLSSTEHSATAILYSSCAHKQWSQVARQSLCVSSHLCLYCGISYKNYVILSILQSISKLYISMVKPTRCTISQIYFGTTLYMFRTVSPSITRRLRLYIQHHTIQVLWLLASKRPQNLYDIYLMLYVQS